MKCGTRKEGGKICYEQNCYEKTSGLRPDGQEPARGYSAERAADRGSSQHKAQRKTRPVFREQENQYEQRTMAEGDRQRKTPEK